MQKFMDENFILETQTAQKLYHEHAKLQPIIDYHCHLSPKDIAENRQFKNLTQIWLEGDHYKWRAMRANGINEKFITGDASDEEKFKKWAETVPYTMRNPLYHWTHLELLRPFGVSKILNPQTATEIYRECTEKLQKPEFSVQGILKKMNVEVVCTTDDPIDTLEHHQKIKKDQVATKVFPTWRPDKAMAVENSLAYNIYMEQLEKASGLSISSFQHLLDALKKRQDFFEQQGCRLSDHGLETFYAEDYTNKEVDAIFSKIRSKNELTALEILKFKSAMLYHFAVMDHQKGWTQQFHIGAIRNNNTKMFKRLGPDTGYDAIGDFEVARPMSKFFNRLDLEDKLTKTIVYNLNPRDNELLVTLAYSYNDGSLAGKMQFGSGWWFLDQKDGMEKQMNALSNLGLLSRFVGMLTDSRSFLSYPRHDYFRRILCNLLGKDLENGELPAQELDFICKMVENVSYKNAKQYFAF
jgi:glucuronate isomerase